MIDVVYESQSKILDHSRSDSIKNTSEGAERRYSEREDIESLDLTGPAFVDLDITDEYPIIGAGEAASKRSSAPGGLSKRKSFGGMFRSKKEGGTGTVIGLPAPDLSKSGKFTAGDASQSHAGYIESDGVLYAVDSSSYTPTTPTPSTPSSSSSSTSPLPSSSSASALASSPVSISNSRPLFYPAPSGSYCAVFWPESCFYMVFLVRINKGPRLKRLSSTDTIGSGRRGSGNKSRPGRASMQSITEYEEENDDAKQSIKLGSEISSGGTGDDESFVEVDRGRCLSFAWMGTGKIYAVLTPGLRTEINSSRRSSIGAIFSRNEKEKETGRFTPPKIVFKIAPSGATEGSSVDIAVDVSALGDPSGSGVGRGIGAGGGGRFLPQTHEVFGGLLICVSVARSSARGKDSKGGDGSGGQKAISKIEADAIAQQQIENKKEQLEKEKAGGGKKSKTAAASVEQVVAASAVSWEESVGGGSEHYRATQKSRFYILSTVITKKSAASIDTTAPPILAPSLQLQPVGPCMRGVRAVMWDVQSGLCAVLVGQTINILRLEVTPHSQSTTQEHGSSAVESSLRAQKGVGGNDISLCVVSTVDLQSHLTTSTSMAFSSAFTSMVALSWRNGQLFALTNSELLLICTDYPYSKKHSNNATADSKQGIAGKSKISGSEEQNNRSKCPVTNVFILASSDAETLQGSSPGTRNLNPHLDLKRVTSFDKSDKDESCGDSHAPCGVLPLKSATGWLDIVGCRKGNLLISSR